VDEQESKLVDKIPRVLTRGTYFLLKNKYSLWDLLNGTQVKFKNIIKIDTMLLAEDFLKVEEFMFLPRMIKSVSIETLKRFCRSLPRAWLKNTVE